MTAFMLNFADLKNRLALLAIGFFLALGVSVAEEHTLGSLPQPLPSTAALESPIPSASPSLELSTKLDGKEVRSIRRNFRKRLDEERSHFKREESRGRKERDAARKARKKEWDKTEMAALRKFFSENTHGPAKRSYVVDFSARRKAFYESLKAEEKADRSDYETRWKQLEDSQKIRYQEVEGRLRQSLRPSDQTLR